MRHLSDVNSWGMLLERSHEHHGHKTRSMYNRYRSVEARDLREATYSRILRLSRRQLSFFRSRKQ